MSPIADIQARFRELGRIRLGYQEPTGKTYTTGTKKGQPVMRPVKSDRFRLTSPRQHLIEEAADLFGGTPEPWDNQGSAEHQLVVEAAVLPVVVPVTADPNESCCDQWYELWDGGGLLRRCDGLKQDTPNRGGPCACPADPNDRNAAAAEGKACKPTSRLRVMFPGLTDLGIWLLVTHSFHAATQLAGVTRMLDLAGERGATFIPARLCLQAQEGARRPGQPRHKFYVPAISFDFQLGAVLDSLDAVTRPGELGVGAADIPAPSAAVPAPAPQRSYIDQLYDNTDRRVRALNDSEWSRLVSFCADRNPPIPLDGVTVDGAVSRKTVAELAQGDVTKISEWLDRADKPPPCTEEAVVDA